MISLHHALQESGEASGCENGGSEPAAKTMSLPPPSAALAPLSPKPRARAESAAAAAAAAPPPPAPPPVPGSVAPPPGTVKVRTVPVAHGRGPHPAPPHPVRPGIRGRGPELGKEEREIEELMSALRELTRFSSFQDVMRSLDTVCKDLKNAIKKLEKLFRKVKVRQ